MCSLIITLLQILFKSLIATHEPKENSKNIHGALIKTRVNQGTGNYLQINLRI